MSECLLDLLRIIEKLGFKPIDNRGTRLSGMCDDKECQWFTSEITIGNQKYTLFLDTTLEKWRISFEHPMWLTEEGFIKDFSPTIDNIIRSLMEIAFLQGDNYRFSEIRKSLGIE